eukprot:33189-Alexandrium_andersonii.AAC.1
MVGVCRRFRPASFGRMAGAYRRFRPAGFWPPPRRVGRGELGPELGGLSVRASGVPPMGIQGARLPAGQ